jgi:hypothetical protein
MITLVVVLIIMVIMFVWSALATCSLAGFRPKASFRSQLRGLEGHERLVASLLELPGVRKLESDERGVLVSVMPVLSSLGRGYGLFVVVRREKDHVVLLGRPRIALPTLNMLGALRELERAARNQCVRLR